MLCLEIMRNAVLRLAESTTLVGLASDLPVRWPRHITSHGGTFTVTVQNVVVDGMRPFFPSARGGFTENTNLIETFTE